MSKQELAEPKGIAFFSINTGETHYARLEPTIQAYINSSDMGINASRGQDFGWRLSKEWVQKVRDFRDDETKMDTLAAKLRLEDGETPNTIQILNYMYGRQVRQYLQRLKEGESPFAEQYQRDISQTPQAEQLPADTDTPSEDPEEDAVQELVNKPKPAVKQK